MRSNKSKFYYDEYRGEMDLIVCRNIIISFDNVFQNYILKLFHDSLAPKGVLCLSSKKSVEFSNYRSNFHELAGKEKIYQLRI
ncbi:MAG: CheR family methyltransferase [Calditrichaceae bacterium]